MKVIGAGLPRTATLSQKVALEMLGLEPCYHMVTVLADLDQAARWRAALDGEVPVAEILNGFEATVDWPGSFLWRELVNAYPEAKVLLSVRDGDAWARSMRDTVWGVVYGEILIRHLSDARRTIDPQWNGFMEMMTELWQRSGLVTDTEPTLEGMSAAMARHNDEVVAGVAPARLLVWKPSDGWEPLCEFLEVPVPTQPFPRVNDSAQFADRIVDGALAAIQEHRLAEEDSLAAH